MNALRLLFLLIACPPIGISATSASELSAVEWADMASQARLSDGFEARMSITVVAPGGLRHPPFKLSVVGQVGTNRQRLKIRGIAPELVRNRSVEVSRFSDSRIDVLSYDTESTEEQRTDPYARLYESGLVAWDMVAPWWKWPKQSLGEVRFHQGRTCTMVRSRAPTGTSKIVEVASCINREARLALRTELLDEQGRMVRSMKVERMIRTDSGGMAAKRIVITEANGTMTEIEIYSGDEHYQIPPDTFERSELRSTSRK